MVLVHCPCGTGCSECYGKVNCGCPDCFEPEKKPRKKRKLQRRRAEISEPNQLESICFMDAIEYQTCQVVEHKDMVLEMVVVIRQKIGHLERRRPQSCIELQFSRPRRRSDFLTWESQSPEVKQKPARPRSGGLFLEKEVGPPRQTKFFCRTCKRDICNACFTSSVCAKHSVQWIGSAKFHCSSPYHQVPEEPLK